MKIRRYLAADMRLALKQVREDQGPDAVILNTRQIGDQVEVVAAIDFDPLAFEEASQAKAPAQTTHDFSRVLNRQRASAAQTSAREEPAAPDPLPIDSELNALRRMLETQLAALAWNDLSRRAPVHTEVLKSVSAL